MGDLSGVSLGANAGSAGLAGELSGLLQGRQNPDGWDVGARLQVRDLARLGEKGSARCSPRRRREHARQGRQEARAGRFLRAGDRDPLRADRGERAGEGASRHAELRLEGHVQPGLEGPHGTPRSRGRAPCVHHRFPRAWRLAGTLPDGGREGPPWLRDWGVRAQPRAGRRLRHAARPNGAGRACGRRQGHDRPDRLHAQLGSPPPGAGGDP